MTIAQVFAAFSLALTLHLAVAAMVIDWQAGASAVPNGPVFRQFSVSLDAMPGVSQEEVTAFDSGDASPVEDVPPDLPDEVPVETVTSVSVPITEQLEATPVDTLSDLSPASLSQPLSAELQSPEPDVQFAAVGDIAQLSPAEPSYSNINENAKVIQPQLASSVQKPEDPKIENIGQMYQERRVATVSSLPGAAIQPSTSGDAGMESYTTVVLGWLEKHKRYPGSARKRSQQGTVMLYFSIDRVGQVLAADLRESSGHGALDRAAMDMLNRAQPLPEIPLEVSRNHAEFLVPVSFFLN